MAEKIYIDQGHNPQNPNSGAEGNGLREQDLVYTIGVRLSEILRAGGLTTRLSRPSPTTQLGTSVATSLAARVNDANSWGADYFISLHTNASSVTTASGSECFVYSEGSPAYVLAENVAFQLNAATGLRDRGVFTRPSLYVLRRTAMPAVLVELGFITNPFDAELMRSSPEVFAAGVANGLFAYLGLL
ncbi:MAG: N-acetylmuramoyl-L-alanine amidase [Clostridia bacterium]|nr:N-acetylmuramoyl-L-alanine amidase [Clostridia bacterium]